MNLHRRLFQALHVNRQDIENNLRVLRPKLDYKNRLADRNELDTNIMRRDLSASINIDDLYEKWNVYKSELKKKRGILARIDHWNNMLSKEHTMVSSTNENEKNLIDYRQRLKNALSDLDRIENAEDPLAQSFLILPNKISEQTPDREHIQMNFGEKSIHDFGHHLQYEHLIEYHENTIHYLMGDAAKFDFLFTLNCIEYFQQNNYTLFSNPDFIKTALIEAAAISLNNVFQLDEQFHEQCTNLLHLVGKGSMMSYLGFAAKYKINRSVLPVRFVSSGKIYKPITKNNFGLFETMQSTAVEIFLAGTKEQIENEFDKVLKQICHIFESQNIHFRVVYLPANRLQLAECFSASIEMFSPHLKKYIEIGRLSNYSDFLSKRIMFRLDKDDQDNVMHMMHVLSGTVCNVTKLLAIILETNDGSIPNSVIH